MHVIDHVVQVYFRARRARLAIVVSSASRFDRVRVRLIQLVSSIIPII